MKRALTILRWTASALVALILVATAAVYGASELRMRRTYDIRAESLAVTRDSVAIARGEHVTHSFGGCVDCHGENLAGNVIVDDVPMGRLYAANLTRGTGGSAQALTDAQLERAIRHGIGRDGRPLKVMPARDFSVMSDADVAAVIAYIRSVPAVDKSVPAPRLGPLARALLLAGKLPLLDAERIDHATKTPVSVPASTTAEYGRYIASVGCKGCHGQALSGGRIETGPPDWPQAANLTPAGNLSHYSLADFTRVLREGKRPDGSDVNPIMPWKKITRNLTDDEIAALYAYLRTLPPTPTGTMLQTASR